MKPIMLLLLTLAALSFLRLPFAGQSGTQQSPAQAPSPTVPASAWQRYTYPGEEFSVELPDMPLVFHTTRTVGMYETETMRVFDLYSGGVVFFVISYDRPRQKETLDYIAKYHPGAGILKPAGDSTLDGFVGKAYEVDYSYVDSPISFRGGARVFRARTHAYLVEAYANEDGHSQEVERFLNSLSLTATPGRAVKDDEPVPPFHPSKPPPAGSQGGGNAEPRSQPTPDTRPPDGPFTPKEVTRKAVIVYKPEPGFTEEARKENVTGVVRLRAILSSAGKVTSISVVKWLPEGLTEQAIQAARHIRFFPAKKDGREVSQYVTLEYNFNIY